MDRTRLHLLANVGHVNCIEDPAAPSGGSQKPPEGATNDGSEETNDADGAEGSEDEDPKDEDEGSDEGFDSLPESWQRKVKSLRTENGRHRVANKELTETNKTLQDSLKEAKSQDDIDAAVTEYRDRIAELENDNARATHTAGLPKEQAALVHGNTPDEIKESANAVRAAFEAANAAGDPGDVDGGRNPGGDDDASLSPRERAQRLRDRQGRRR